MGMAKLFRPGAADERHSARYRRVSATRPGDRASLAKAAGLYMICTISKHRAERRGYADALMFDWQGRVAECTGANIFFVKDGTIHTPIADCFLAGITRATVIDLARSGDLNSSRGESCRPNSANSTNASSREPPPK